MAIKISGTTVIDDSRNLFVAAGSTAARPTPVTGAFRFNTDDDSFEGYDGTAWGSIGGGGGVPLNANNDYYLDANLVVDGEVISLSDVNFKENIISIDTSKSIEVIKGLRPVYYNMIGDDARKVGFIAQEVQEILPEVVYDADSVLHLSYGNMIAVLTGALQDALTRIEELENVISSK